MLMLLNCISSCVPLAEPGAANSAVSSLSAHAHGHDARPPMQVLTGAEQGCNVIVWFAVNIRRNATSGQPEILGGPAPDCVARVAQNLSDSNLSTLHLVSIGGWDQQHPYASAPAADVWEAFKYWNEKVVARPDTGFKGYDGIDWDVEGADSPADPANLMSVALLDLIGDVSKMAKKEGYVVSMAPMESYLDPSTSEFNRSLLQRYPEWNHLAPDFAYHGRNTLAYSLARHGKWWSVEKSVDAGAGTYVKKEKRTFDMISIQFYETYSHANYAIVHESVNASVYFAQVVSRLTKGWLVDFSTDDDPGVSRLGMQSVDVHSKQLVLGVANAWAGVGDPVKALYLTPFQLRCTLSIMQRARVWHASDVNLAGRCTRLSSFCPYLQGLVRPRVSPTLLGLQFHSDCACPFVNRLSCLQRLHVLVAQI